MDGSLTNYEPRTAAVAIGPNGDRDLIVTGSDGGTVWIWRRTLLQTSE